MPERQLTTLVEGGAYFEAPRWHEGTWWVSDFYRHTVFRILEDGTEEPVVEVEGQPSGLGWAPDGSLLIVSMTDHRLLRLSAAGELAEVADVSEHCGGNLNDLVVSEDGWAYAGEFGFDLMNMGEPDTANLLRIGPTGEVAVAADEMLFPNGMVITPDRSTLIVGESAGCRYTAFAIEDDGSLSNRRVWAQLAPEPPRGGIEEMLAELTVSPDGCCLDADGNIWLADAMNERLLHIAEGGEVLEEITAPEGLGFFACMLGGDDGRTLLVSAAPDFFEHNRRDTREAVLLTTTVDVPHAGRP